MWERLWRIFEVSWGIRREIFQKHKRLGFLALLTSFEDHSVTYCIDSGFFSRKDVVE